MENTENDKFVINNRFVEITDSTIEFWEIFGDKGVKMGYLFRKGNFMMDDFNELFILIMKWYMRLEMELLT